MEVQAELLSGKSIAVELGTESYGKDAEQLYSPSRETSAEARGDLVEAALEVFEVRSAFVHVPCVAPMLPTNK